MGLVLDQVDGGHAAMSDREFDFSCVVETIVTMLRSKSLFTSRVHQAKVPLLHRRL